MDQQTEPGKPELPVAVAALASRIRHDFSLLAAAERTLRPAPSRQRQLAAIRTAMESVTDDERVHRLGELRSELQRRLGEHDTDSSSHHLT